MTHATLDNLWLRTHSRLLGLANGATASYDPKTKGGTGNRAGPPKLHQDIEELENDWAKAHSKKAKRRVIEDALAVVFRHSSPAQKKAALPYMPSQSRDQFRKETLSRKLLQQRSGTDGKPTKEWREAIATEDGSVRDVADIYGVSKSTVQRYREEFANRAHSNGHVARVEIVRSTARFLRRQIKGLDTLGNPDSV